MTLSEADLLFATPERIKPLNELLKLPSTKRIRLKGLAGSAPAMLFALLEKRRKPYLLVADDADAAGYLYNDLCRVAGREKVAVFPSGYRRDIKYGQPDPPAQILRTDAIDAIAGSKELRYVVSYPEALAESVPAPDSLADHTLRLKTGTKTGMTDLLTRLREEGFRQTDYVYEPGQFARRGSIVDIYSFSNPLPYRLDFFGDEIDSIREFNVETQLSERRLEEISVIPAGMQTKSASVSLPEFIGRGCVLLCQSRRWLLDRVKAVCSETFSSSAMIAEEGDPDAMSNIVDFDAFEQTVAKMTCAEFGLGELPERGYDAVLDFNCTPQALYHKNFDLIAESFSSFIKKGYRILLLSDSPQQADRLRAIFAERGDVIVFSAVEGTIHEGFIDAESKVCFFTDHQIFDRFHKYSLKSDRARSAYRPRHREIRRPDQDRRQRSSAGDDQAPLSERRHHPCLHPRPPQALEIPGERGSGAEDLETRDRGLAAHQGPHEVEDEGYRARPHQALRRAPPGEGPRFRPRLVYAAGAGGLVCLRGHPRPASRHPRH